ncbi:hypothetical protein DFJ63DRAFT_335297 [Scheffersomyces coipomensis]|uniref:uncharacterized protein n=1 Tax=Scheffersomyces coipomensis TaxID=1788519 RepID=UPI00315DC2C0
MDAVLNNEFINQSDIQPIVAFIKHIDRLPLEIIVNIFKSLDRQQIVQFLCYCTQLSSYTRQLIDLVFGSKLEFIFESEKIKVFPHTNNKITDIELAKQFLSIPDSHLKQLLIVVSNKSIESCNQLIEDHLESLQSSIDEIIIVFGNAQVKTGFKVFELSNLKAISFADSTVDSSLFSTPEFINHPGITRLTFDLIKISDDGLISSLPKNIISLQVVTGWNRPTTLAQTPWPLVPHIEQFKNLQDLKITFTNIFDEQFYQLIEQTINLSKLEIIKTNISTLKLAKLPRTLKQFNLSDNQDLKSVDINNNDDWPVELVHISLNNCQINNESFVNMCQFQWPKKLSVLEMANNLITDFDKLKNIPESVVSLKLGCSRQHPSPTEPTDNNRLIESIAPRLRVFEVQRYTFKENDSIEFPDLIVALAIQGSEIYNGQIFKKYPKNLTALNLSGCNISTIDLCSLETLTILLLIENKIQSLNDVNFPTNIRQLNMNMNHIRKLSNQDQFFNPNTSIQFKQLMSFSLIGNKISDIDSDISIPPNLVEFRLTGNQLTNITIPDSITYHQRLQLLDISRNQLRNINFKNDGRIGNAVRLKVFDLSFNLIAKIDQNGQQRPSFPFALSYEYNKRIENGFGRRLQVVDPNVNRVHTFK